MRIVIDGYNILKALPECRPLEALDPERAREHLIALLSRYRWLKGYAVTVVFDGWLGGQPLPRRLNARGIQVIYSQRGEQADEVIRRMGPQVAHQGIAVSSDRALARDLAHLGVEVIGPSEFGARLRATLQNRAQEGTDDQQDVLPSTPQSQPKRTGRRASRAERRHERRLRNL